MKARARVAALAAVALLGTGATSPSCQRQGGGLAAAPAAYSAVGYDRPPCVASFYGGPRDHSLSPWTATGARFNAWLMRAAVPTAAIPYGARLRVTNLANGRSVVVTVNDRGPALYLHRCIDLTLGAFEVIAPEAAGTITVRIHVISIPRT